MAVGGVFRTAQTQHAVSTCWVTHGGQNVWLQERVVVAVVGYGHVLLSMS